MSGRRRGGGSREVYGLHPVRELLRARQVLYEVAVAEGRQGSDVLDEIVDLAREAGVPVVEASRADLDGRTDGAVHQGVVARAPEFSYRTLADVVDLVDDLGEPPFLVALDGVTDPHNLGSVARTAEALGAHALLVPGRRAAGVTPAAEKAAAGAFAHLPLARVTNLVNALRTLSERSVWSIGLEMDNSVDIANCALLTEPLVLVVGSEGRGLARLSQVQCDQLVNLPMRGRVESLNASVAAALAMWEVRRRRDAQGSTRSGS